jgi:hypothetical protein
MHPDPTPGARFSPRTTTPAPMARGRSVAAKDGRRVIGRRAGRKGRLWIQKTPGVQRRQASRFLAHCLTWRQEAANHHEFRLSGQSTPAPSPRQDPRGGHLPARPANACRCMLRHVGPYATPRRSNRVTFRHGAEVVSSVPEAVFFPSADAFIRCSTRASRPISAARTFHASSSSRPSTRRPIRSIRSRGDLTVTTRPGVVAFHRSRFSRLAPPCSGGGAPCGATHGANFNREAHT